MVIYPPEKACDMEYHNIKHIEVNEIIGSENPLCVKNGDIKLELEKGFYDSLVKIKVVN